MQRLLALHPNVTFSQCQEIRSQPDVDEPQRYATKPHDVAKEESELSHAEKLETGEENVSCT